MNIEELYNKIPKFTCVSGCHKCCGPVPIVFEEALKLQLPLKSETLPFNICTLRCNYESNKGCLIYENRPLMCRLYGTIKALTCTEGGKPERMLTEIEEQEIMNEYYKLKVLPKGL